MRWYLLATALMLGGAVVLGWWRREPVLTVVVDVGQLLVAPETAAPDRWGRGPHRWSSGQRLRADGDAVLHVDGLRWTLANNAEVTFTNSPETWKIAGSGRLDTTGVPVQVHAPVGTLTVSAHSAVTWQTTPDATEVEVVRGSAEAAGDLAIPEGRRVLLLAERVALRVEEPGSEGLGLDAEALDFAPPDHGWFAGVVVPVEHEPGRTRALAAVAEPATIGGEADGEIAVWRLTLRRSGRPFAGVRRAHARVWTAPTVDHVRVTWTAIDGRVLDESVVPVVAEAESGWWDLEVRLSGDEVAVGDRLAVFSLAVVGPASGSAPLRLAELVLTP